MTHSPVARPLPWLSLKEAWKCSCWSSIELLGFAKRGVLKAQLISQTWHFEPEGFYMAMREELALQGWMSLRDAAQRFDVDHIALLELVHDETLYALYADTDWYIEPVELARIPSLIDSSFVPTQDLLSAPQRELDFNVKTSSPTRPAPAPQSKLTPSPGWITFKEAVRRSKFTHAELHQAVRDAHVVSTRLPNGRLALCAESLAAYTPSTDWLPLRHITAGAPARLLRRRLKALEQGTLKGVRMGGIWYVSPGQLTTT